MMVGGYWVFILCLSVFPSCLHTHRAQGPKVFFWGAVGSMLVLSQVLWDPSSPTREGLNPGPVGAGSPDPWTTREVPFVELLTCLDQVVFLFSLHQVFVFPLSCLLLDYLNTFFQTYLQVYQHLLVLLPGSQTYPYLFVIYGVSRHLQRRSSANTQPR